MQITDSGLANSYARCTVVLFWCPACTDGPLILASVWAQNVWYGHPQMPQTTKSSVELDDPTFPHSEDECKCGDPDCVGHALIDRQTTLGLQKIVQIPGFTSRTVRDRQAGEVVIFDDAINLPWASECYLLAERWGDDPRSFLCRWVRRGETSAESLS
jgi:hypothetical protein